MSVSSSESAPPAPSPPSECVPPLESKGGGEQHSLAGEGAGEHHSDDWRESMALCILCACLLFGWRIKKIHTALTPLALRPMELIYANSDQVLYLNARICGIQILPIELPTNLMIIFILGL